MHDTFSKSIMVPQIHCAICNTLMELDTITICNTLMELDTIVVSPYLDMGRKYGFGEGMSNAGGRRWLVPPFLAPLLMPI